MVLLVSYSECHNNNNNCVDGYGKADAIDSNDCIGLDDEKMINVTMLMVVMEGWF